MFQFWYFVEGRRYIMLLRTLSDVFWSFSSNKILWCFIVLRTSTSEKNILAISETTEEDCHRTIWKIAEHVRISYGTTQSIISDDSHYLKCLPRLLMENQKAIRPSRQYGPKEEISSSTLSLLMEVWLPHYTSESKKASMEWRKPGGPALRKAKTRIFAGKDLATIFWGCRVILLVYFLQVKRYKCWVILPPTDEVRLTYRSERRDMPIRSTILFHDDARSPKTALIHKNFFLPWANFIKN